MKWVIILVFCALVSNSFAQVFVTRCEEIFGDRPMFVQNYIRKYSVKTIGGTVSTKAQLDEIRPTKDIHFYKFNRAGELTLEYKTQFGDTLITIYVYDERSNVIVKRKADKFGFHSYHYRYDNLNRLVYYEYRAEKNNGQDELTHVPDESLVVTSERFEYITLENNNYKKIYYNNIGIAYKEEFYYFNEKNWLIKQESALKNGAGRTAINYAYDNDGRLLIKESAVSLMGNFTTKNAFDYDEKGNTLAQRFYRDEVYMTEYQYLYLPENGLLSAIISRENATNFMTIISFKSYSFFE